MEEKQYYTLSDIAALVQRSHNYIYQTDRFGMIPWSKKIGRSTIILAEDLDKTVAVFEARARKPAK